MVSLSESGTQDRWGDVGWFGGIMREFFRGWKRKLGVLTLLMALVAMAGWVRSLNIGDQFRIPSDNATHRFIVSQHEGLVWHYTQETGQIRLTRARKWYRPIKIMSQLPEEFFIKGTNLIDGDAIDWHVEFYGLYFAEGHAPQIDLDENRGTRCK